MEPSAAGTLTQHTPSIHITEDEHADAEPPKADGGTFVDSRLSLQCHSDDIKGFEKLHGKTILLVNVISQKREFILQEMKKQGLTIVALHPSIETWAEPYIQRWIAVEEGSSPQEILNAIREDMRSNTPKIEGVITFWEEEVPLVARICKEFGFIGNDLATAQNTRNKFAMHEHFAQHGCHAIRQRLLTSARDLEEATRTIGFPAIIKPLYGSDSVFVVRVDSPEEAFAQYEHITSSYLKHPDEMLERVECDKLVYQEFIDGPEFSVECYVQDGVPHMVGINQKTPMEHPYFMETGDICPPLIHENHQKSLMNEAKEALIALGVKNCLAHVEIKLTSKGPQVIEIASRMGGVYIFENTRLVYGFDLIKAGCQIALGIQVTDSPSHTGVSVYAQFFIPETSGTIEQLHNCALLNYIPNVVAVSFSKKVGDTVRVPPDGYEAIGWILVKGKSHDEAKTFMERILTMTKIEVIPDTPYTSPTVIRQPHATTRLIPALSY